MTDARALVDHAWRRGLAPEPRITVSEWADRHRVLPPESAEPGRWRTARVPYLREIMDALSTGSPWERVVFMKGAQLGGTEAGLNWLAYIVANAPGLALLVMPSLDMVRRNTRTRIDPMIEATPELRERVAAPRARDAQNTAFAKAFPGGQLVMTGANSAAGLRSTPARYVMLDEVDGFPDDADGEGDPVDLAIRRTATFRGKRRIFMVSTPTLKGASRIAAAYAESDQRRFVVPCPRCGEPHALAWENLRRGPDGEAFMACPSCGGVIEERDKPALLAAGAWRATAPGDGRTAGFHVSTLYSPFETWTAVAEAHERARDDPARLQVWTNTFLGEPWEDRGADALDADGLAARRESWGDDVPPGVAVVTAGVDVQGDRLEASFWGWGAGEEAWALEHRILYGDPSGPAVWADLDGLLARGFRHARDMPDLPVRACAVDTGGAHTAAAYGFVRARLARRIWGVKGSSDPRAVPWPRRLSRTKGGVQLAVIGVNALKDQLAARLAVAEPGPGFVHFDARLDGPWFSQLVAETRQTRVMNGLARRVWTCPPGVRNEAWDCFVYARAALEGLAVAGLRLDDEAARVAAAPLRAATAPPQRRTVTPAVIRSRWMTGL